MPIDTILEKYLDGQSAYESGYTAGSIYLLEETLELAKQYSEANNRKHKICNELIEVLTNAYITNKTPGKAVTLLSEQLNEDSENIRALYKLFMLYLDVDPDERLALQYYIKASKMSKAKDFEYTADYEIWKLMEFKAKSFIGKREMEYLMIMNEDIERPCERQHLMKQLPIEVVKLILSYLDHKSLYQILKVCKGWRSTILESPLLIGSYNFTGSLTFEKLRKFIRLFDQKVSISDITLDKLDICIKNEEEHTKLLKLLLKCKLKTKALNLSLFKHEKSINTEIIRKSDSQIFDKLLKLNLSSFLSDKLLITIVSILKRTKNLRSLAITFEEDDQYKGLSLKSLLLPELVEFEIHYKWIDDDRYTREFARSLNMPNLKSLKIEASNFSAVLDLLRSPLKLKSLDLIYQRPASFVNDVLLASSPEIVQKLKYLENLSFNKSFERVDEFPLTVEIHSLPNLKKLKFEATTLSTLELDIFLKSCRPTLQSLEILERSRISYKNLSQTNRADALMGERRNHRNGDIMFFDLNYILKSFPKLRCFRLTDSSISQEMFSKMFFDFALLDEIVTLDYMEIHNSYCKIQNTMMMLLSMRDKVFVKHLKILPKIDNTLLQFVESAKASGQIIIIDSVRT